MTAVNYKRLCQIMRPGAIDRDPSVSSHGMASVQREFDESKLFCAERDWCEISLSPALTRRIVKSGKLAIIRTIELTHIFEHSDKPVNEQSWESQFVTAVI
jgi:hypothetical protein